MTEPEPAPSADADANDEPAAPPQAKRPWQTPRLVRLGASEAGGELLLGTDLVVLGNMS